MPLRDVNNLSLNLAQLDSSPAPAVAPLPQGADLVLEDQDDVSAEAGIPNTTLLAVQAQQRQKAISQAADETTFERSAETSTQDASLAGTNQPGTRWSSATVNEPSNLSTDVQSLQQTLDEGGDNLSSGFSDMVDPHASLDGLTAAFYALDVSRFNDLPALPDVVDQQRDDSERDAANASAEAASRAQASAHRAQRDVSSSFLRERSFVAKFDATMPDAGAAPTKTAASTGAAGSSGTAGTAGSGVSSGTVGSAGSSAPFGTSVRIAALGASSGTADSASPGASSGTVASAQSSAPFGTSVRIAALGASSGTADSASPGASSGTVASAQSSAPFGTSVRIAALGTSSGTADSASPGASSGTVASAQSSAPFGTSVRIAALGTSSGTAGPAGSGASSGTVGDASPLESADANPLPTAQGRSSGTETSRGSTKSAAPERSTSSSGTRTTQREVRASDAFRDPVDPISARGDAAQAPVDRAVADTSENPGTSGTLGTSGTSDKSAASTASSPPNTSQLFTTAGKSAAPQVETLQRMPDPGLARGASDATPTSSASGTQALGAQRPSVSSPSVRAKSAGTTESRFVGTADAEVKKTSASEDHPVVEAIGEESGGSAQKKADTHAQHRALFAESAAAPATSTASAPKAEEHGEVAEGEGQQDRSDTSETSGRSAPILRSFLQAQPVSKPLPRSNLKEPSETPETKSESPEGTEHTAGESSQAKSATSETSGRSAPTTLLKSPVPNQPTLKTLPRSAETSDTSKTSETKSKASEGQGDREVGISAAARETTSRPNNPPVEAKSFSEHQSESSATGDTSQVSQKADAIGDEDSASTRRKASIHEQHRALFATPDAATSAGPSTRTMPQSAFKSPAGDKAASASTGTSANTPPGTEGHNPAAGTQGSEPAPAAQALAARIALLFKSSAQGQPVGSSLAKVGAHTSGETSKATPDKALSETSEGQADPTREAPAAQALTTRPNNPPVRAKDFSQQSGQSSGTGDTPQAPAKSADASTETREAPVAPAIPQLRTAAPAPQTSNTRPSAETTSSPLGRDANNASTASVSRGDANAASTPDARQARSAPVAPVAPVASNTRQDSDASTPPPPAMPETAPSDARTGTSTSTTAMPRESTGVQVGPKSRGADTSPAVTTRQSVDAASAPKSRDADASAAPQSRQSADASVADKSRQSAGASTPVTSRPNTEAPIDTSKAAQPQPRTVSMSTSVSVTDKNPASSKPRESATPAAQVLTIIEAILGVEQTRDAANVSSPTISTASEQPPQTRDTHRDRPLAKLPQTATDAMSSNTSGNTGALSSAARKPSSETSVGASSSSEPREMPRIEPRGPQARGKAGSEENPRLAMPGPAMPSAISTAALDPLRGLPLRLSTPTAASTSTGLAMSTGILEQAPGFDPAAHTAAKSTSSLRGGMVQERDDDIVSPWPAHVAGPSTRTLPPRAPLTVDAVAVDEIALAAERQLAQQATQDPSEANDQDSNSAARATLLEQQEAVRSPTPTNTKSTTRRTLQEQEGDVRVEMRSQSDDDDDQRVQPIASQQAPRVRIIQPVNYTGFGAMRISNTPPAGLPQPVLLMLAADIYRMQNARQDKVGDKDLPEDDQDGGVAALKAPNKKDATKKANAGVQGIVADGVAQTEGEGAKAPHIALRAAIMTSALQQPTRTMSMFVMSDETPAVRFFVRDEEGALKPQWIQKPADPDNEDAMFSLDPWVDFAETAWAMVHGPVQPSAEVADNTDLAVKAMETLLGNAAVVQPVQWNDEARLVQARSVYNVARQTNDPFYTPTLAVTDAQVDPRDGLLPGHVYGVVAFYVEAEKPYVIVLEAPSSDEDDKSSFRLFDVPYQAFCRSVRALVTALPGDDAQSEAETD